MTSFNPSAPDPSQSRFDSGAPAAASAQERRAETGREVRAAVRWVGLSLLMVQGVRFGATVLLARLLAPKAFGVVALSAAVIDLIGIVRELGFGAAYIHRRDEDEEAARRATHTAFWLAFATNGLLYVGAVALLPLIDRLMQTDGLVPVLRMMLLVFLIDGVGTIPSFALQKRMAFGRHTATEVLSATTYAAVAISLALTDHGVFSLVYGHLCARTLHMGLSLAFARHRPRLVFSPRIARELFAYGKYMWGFSIVSALGRSLDRFLVGRFLGTSTLGLYSIAMQLCRIPSNHISRLVNRVTFPALARHQDEPEALATGFEKTLRHVSFVSLPVAFGFLAVSPEFVPVVYGERWLGAIPVIGILAFYGMSLSVSSIAGPVFQATGRPQVLLVTSIIHQTLLALLLVSLRDFGVTGIAWAVLVPILLSSTIAFVWVRSILALPARAILDPLLRASIAGAAMWLGVRVVAAALVDVSALPAILGLGIEVVVGAGLYVTMCVAINRETTREILGTAAQIFGQHRSRAAHHSGGS